jgi:hypothetical protein
MHPALHSNVGVRDTRGQQLAQRTQVKGILWCNAPPLLQHLLQLLEDGILEDGVDDQDQGRHDAGEQARRALVTHEGEEGAEGGRGFLCGCGCARERLVRAFRLARCHARVYDPDGVGHEDGGATGEGARHHGFDRGELGGGATGFERGLFEEGASPFVPWMLSVHGQAV